jgi:glucose-6-phosphate isomerase
MPDVSAFSLGALIALFERAVGLYAFMIGINAYHQPGVEAGKKAAGEVDRAAAAAAGGAAECVGAGDGC